MSGIIDIHTEILNDAQVNLLHALSKAFMNSDFYLAGGTALALKSYLELYIKKYKNRDIGHVIRSLVYFRDAETEPELTMLAPFDWVKMKAAFEDWVKNISC